jgi:hypothetical protein
LSSRFSARSACAPTATSARCAHCRRPRSYHQVADRLEPCVSARPKVSCRTGCQNSRDTLPRLTRATEERCRWPLRGVARIDSKSEPWTVYGRDLAVEGPKPRQRGSAIRTGSRSRVP